MAKEMKKVCKIHGETVYFLESNGYYRCKKCRQAAVERRRKKLKILAIEYKGGKCSRCGYSKYYGALEFHHRDPSKKEFGFSAKGHTRAWAKLQLELDKCDLVCSNCHREIHGE